MSFFKNEEFKIDGSRKSTLGLLPIKPIKNHERFKFNPSVRQKSKTNILSGNLNNFFHYESPNKLPKLPENKITKPLKTSASMSVLQARNSNKASILSFKGETKRPEQLFSMDRSPLSKSNIIQRLQEKSIFDLKYDDEIEKRILITDTGHDGESSKVFRRQADRTEKSFETKPLQTEDAVFQQLPPRLHLKNLKFRSVSKESTVFREMVNGLLEGIDKLLVIPDLEKESTAYETFMRKKGQVSLQLLETLAQTDSPMAKCFEAMHQVFKNLVFCQNESTLEFLKENLEEGKLGSLDPGKRTFMEVSFVLEKLSRSLRDKETKMIEEYKKSIKEVREAKETCERSMKEFQMELENVMFEKKAQLEMRLSMMTLDLIVMKKKYNEKEELDVEILKDIMVPIDEDATQEQIKAILSRVKSLLKKNIKLEEVFPFITRKYFNGKQRVEKLKRAQQETTESYPKLVESHMQVVQKLKNERLETKRLLEKIKELKGENLKQADDLRLFHMKEDLTPRPNFDKLYA